MAVRVAVDTSSDQREEVQQQSAGGRSGGGTGSGSRRGTEAAAKSRGQVGSRGPNGGRRDTGLEMTNEGSERDAPETGWALGSDGLTSVGQQRDAMHVHLQFKFHLRT